MVESNPYIDNIFHSLADPIRRDILRRLTEAEYSVSQIASRYDVSLAAISKHLKVLEAAQLIVKKRRGKEQVVHISKQTLNQASQYLAEYEALINARFDSLESLLLTDEPEKKHGKSTRNIT